MADICWLHDAAACRPAIAGGKGASLAELVQLGVPVPDGFVITADAYAEESRRWGLAAAVAPLAAKRDWRAVAAAARTIILSQPIGESLRGALADAYRRMGAPLVAVRSSATAEDLGDASFAGQYDTCLGVGGEEALVEAVRRCWASIWGERALDYRHQRSIDHASVAMAVVVQRMVEADAAGVVFTVDPIANRNDRLYVEAAAGGGEGVVSGTARTVAYRVDRATLQPEEPAAADGVLDSERLRDLCRMALEIERRKGRPQDIEFAVARGAISILQARPITTPAGAPPDALPPLGKPSLVDRLVQPVAAERYALAPRPLDNIIFIRVVGAVMYAIERLGGRISDADKAAFRAEIWRQAYRLPPVRLTGRFFAAEGTYLRMLRSDWMAWWMGGARDELIAACELPDVTQANDGELLARMDHILAVWEKALNERFYASSPINARHWLDRLVDLAVGPWKRRQVVADLMAGLHTPTSDVNDSLWELSRLARRDPDLRAAVSALRLDAIPATPQGRTFKDSLDAFLDRYGHREGAGYYLSTPTWGRDPTQVLRLVASLAQADARPDMPEDVQQRYRAARTLVLRRLRFVPALARIAEWMIDRFRALDTFRETSHFDITRPIGALQIVAGEVGRRLCARGVLRDPDDLFYLTSDEMRAWLTAGAPPREHVADLIQRRRATYEVANSRWRTRRASSSRARVLKGTAASRGVATGRARVILNEGDFHLLEPGEVLVCPYSNPAWTPLFFVAAAVVSETGGAASHAAIVAREYGIPAVMSVRGAIDALGDRAEVTVDGDRGLVVRS